MKTAVDGLSDSGLVENVEISIIDRKPDTSKTDTQGTETENEELEEIVDVNDEGVIIEGGELVDFRFLYKKLNTFSILFLMFQNRQCIGF